MSNPFTSGEMQFVRGTPPKKLVDFNEMVEYFPEIELSRLVPGDNYLVFTQSPGNPNDGAYTIVKYLRTDPIGNITVSELFQRNRSTYGWSNLKKMLRGSRFFKEEETYPVDYVYKDPTSFTNLSERYKRSRRYFFRDIGERQSEFNDSELSDKRVADIIEEIVDSYFTDEDEGEDGNDDGESGESGGGESGGGEVSASKGGSKRRKSGKRVTTKRKLRKNKTLRRSRQNKKMFRKSSMSKKQRMSKNPIGGKGESDNDNMQKAYRELTGVNCNFEPPIHWLNKYLLEYPDNTAVVEIRNLLVDANKMTDEAFSKLDSIMSN